jgi:hypothetical protein
MSDRRSKSALAAEDLVGRGAGYQLDAWLGVTSTIRPGPVDRAEKVRRNTNAPNPTIAQRHGSAPQ